MGPDPAIAWAVVVTLGVLLSIWGGVRLVTRGDRAQKRDVKIEEGVVPKGEHDQLVRRVDKIQGDIDQIRVDMRQDRLAVDAANEARASRIHTRIDEVHERINTVDAKIAEIPHQTFALLTNARTLNKDSRP